MNSKIEVYELETDNLNYDYGFRAMCDMLARMSQDEFELQYQIRKAERVASHTRGERNDFAVDHLIGLYEYSGFQDAAHSMAAVGMIAPYVESLFKDAFKESDIDWPRQDIVRNLINGIESMGLKKFMPGDLEVTLTALFEYRNKMLHNSFEWPLEVRKRFARRLENSEWPPEWFSSASIEDDPWMFYMTETFIDHCIDTIQKIAVGIGAFEHERLSDQL